jgi:hypothetical protein
MKNRFLFLRRRAFCAILSIQGDDMKKFLGIVLKVLLVILAVIVLAALFLVARWLITHEDPTAFLPDKYVAYFQVPSIKGLYDEWLNLEAADVVLARPDLSQYRRVVTDARGLALTNSPILKALLDMPADVMLLQNKKLLVVLPLGWRGIFTPLARIVGPSLQLKGFSFLSESGVSMYRYSSGQTTIHAAFVNDVAIISLDPDVVKETISRRQSNTGLSARASRELLDRVRLRSKTAVRVMVDTAGIASELLAGSGFGDKLLKAVELPGQSMLDIQLGPELLKLGANLPVSITLPELEKMLSKGPAPIGVLRYVPASAYLLSVSNIAPLRELYRLAAAFQGKDVEDIYKKADEGARSVVGAGIEELLFSWIGAEVGAFMLEDSREAVFFARITDSRAYENAIKTLTTSIVAGKDSSLVLDGERMDRLALPWYVTMILDTVGLDVPEPYYFTRGDYFFLSLDAQNLASVAKAGDTGDNLAHGTLYARLTEGIPSDASLMAWYDMEKTEPFFIKGTGLLSEILRLYGRGVAAVRANQSQISIVVSSAHAAQVGAKLLPGYPLSPQGGVSGDVLAFRFTDWATPRLAYIRDRSTLALTEVDGTPIAEAALEPDSVLVPEPKSPGMLEAIWAVSPGGTVWRFGSKLALQEGFPIATGISSTMPPTVIGGKLALYSKADAGLVFIAADGGRTMAALQDDSPLYSPPDFADNLLAYYPKSFDSKVHLAAPDGTEKAGWPVEASGISSSSPRLVADGQSLVVTFISQAGTLHAWDLSAQPVPGFPVTLPGVFFAAPEPLPADGKTALAVIAQDGSLSLVGLDGGVLRQTAVEDIDGKNARIFIADLYGNKRRQILLYGAGAFTAGFDDSLRPLPGFPVKGVTTPQVIDANRDGAPDYVTAGLDGKIYVYTMGKVQ